MRHASLFSGIGGFDLAAKWMGWENVFQVEWDSHCQAVLKKNFPGVDLYSDIDDFNGTKYTNRIDVLTGGPPCQPASLAGKRKGEKDDRWKWPQAIRVFGEVRPSIAVFENPDDLLTLDNGRAFEGICLSLEAFGYKVETYGIPAACVGAWHERDRIWIIAYANSIGRGNGQEETGEVIRHKKRNGATQKQSGEFQQCRDNRNTQVITDFNASGLQSSAWSKLGSVHKQAFTPQGCESGGGNAETGAYWEVEPGVVRMVHGLPNRVDRIKSLGNSIVPQVAFEIFKAISNVL